MSQLFSQSKNPADMINGNFAALGVRPLSENAVWYNRDDKSFYEAPIDTPIFLRENKMLALPKLIAAAQSYVKDGEAIPADFDKSSYFEGRYEALADDYYRKYIPQVKEYKKIGLSTDAAKALLMSQYQMVGSASATVGGGGGAVHPDTLGGIERLNVLSGIMAIGEIDHVAQNAIPRRTVQFIKGTFFKRKQMKAQRGIRTGKPILTTQVEIEDQTYEISGIGTHVATHWEVRLLPYYVDQYQESLNTVAQAITEAKADEVIETVEGHGTTPVSVNSWSANTGGESTNNPILDINSAMGTIQQNGGNATRMTVGPAGSAALETNRWANEGQAAAIVSQMGQNKQYNWRGLLVTVDARLAADKAIIFSNNAFQAYQGPVQTFDYEDVHTRTRGEYYLEYFGAQVTNNLEVVELGGVD